MREPPSVFVNVLKNEVLLVGTSHRLTRWIAQSFEDVVQLIWATPSTLRERARRPIVVVVTWADVLSDADGVSLLTRLSPLAGEDRSITICAIPFGAFVTEGRSARVWLRRPEDAPADPIEALSAACTRMGIHARIVATPMLACGRVHEVAEYPSLINRIAGVAKSLAEEIRDKAPTYLSTYPLCLHTSAGEPSVATPKALAVWLRDTAAPPAAPGRAAVVDLTCATPWQELQRAIAEGAGCELEVSDGGAADTAASHLLSELIFEPPGLTMDTYSGGSSVAVSGLSADGVGDAIRAACAAPLLRWESAYRTTHEFELDVFLTKHSVAAAAGDVSPVTSSDSYFDSGGPGPVVLMLAPTGIDPGYFGNLAAELLPDHRIIIWVEGGGEGRRDAATRCTQIESLIKLFERAKLDSTHVVGWCAGAPLAGALAQARPSAVASIVLISPDLDGHVNPTREYKNVLDLFSLIARSPGDAPVILARARSVARMSTSENMEQYRSGARMSPLQYRSPGLVRRAARVFDDLSHVVRWACQWLGTIQALDNSGSLLRFKGPVLGILGTHDSLLDYEGTKKRCGALAPRAIVSIRGGNHYALTEHAPSLSAILRSWFTYGECPTADHAVDGGRLIIER